jgi:hypothetical protein
MRYMDMKPSLEWPITPASCHQTGDMREEVASIHCEIMHKQVLASLA